MGSKSRTCAVCRKQYEFCTKCKEDQNKPLWMFTFCSENCHDVYDITSKFENGRISIEDANAQINKLDLSKIDNFGTSYKASIGKIMSYVKPVVEPISEPIVEPVIEVNDEPIIEDVIIEETATETPVVEEVIRKPKRKKANVE